MQDSMLQIFSSRPKSFDCFFHGSSAVTLCSHSLNANPNSDRFFGLSITRTVRHPFALFLTPKISSKVVEERNHENQVKQCNGSSFQTQVIEITKCHAVDTSIYPSPNIYTCSCRNLGTILPFVGRCRWWNGGSVDGRKQFRIPFLCKAILA